MHETRWILLALSAPAAAAAGCAASDYGAESARGDDDDSYYGDDDAPSDGGDAEADDDSEPPPEEENDFVSARPAGADHFVFVVNTQRDTVSKIHAETLAVSTLPTGARPIQVEASADGRFAVTFNADSDDVSVVDVVADTVSDVPVREDLDAISMAPDGAHVIAWYDAARAEEDPDPTGVHSFNDVTVVDLEDLSTVSFAVGFNPVEVEFTPDGQLAVLVSDGAISLIDLSVPTADMRAELVTISEDPLDPPAVEELEVTPDGRFAYGRVREVDALVAVDLETRDVMTIPAGEDPSDMDLTPDGDQVVVVSRGTQELLVFDSHDPLVEPRVVPVPAEVTAGSVYLSPTGGAAVVYSTAVRQDRFGYWEIADDTIDVYPLVKPVAAARVVPGGESVIFFHTLEDAEGAEPGPYSNQWSLSLVRLDDFLVEPVILEDEAEAYVDSDDGRYGVFLMAENRHLGVIDYGHLLVDDVEVPSIPRHLGMLPVGGLAYVSQEHPLGRISFLDPGALSTTTVTGFELNSEIEP